MKHVAVIGAGIVGAFTALELLRDGHRVTLVEAGRAGRRALRQLRDGKMAITMTVQGLRAAGQVELASLTGEWSRYPASASAQGLSSARA
jgi:2-polyprenyl-6-methoxyphenol hydroxylase-like FAD-dependent oxidoreductase